jgi:hypothetical protein
LPDAGISDRLRFCKNNDAWQARIFQRFDLTSGRHALRRDYRRLCPPRQAQPALRNAGIQKSLTCNSALLTAQPLILQAKKKTLARPF